MLNRYHKITCLRVILLSNPVVQPLLTQQEVTQRQHQNLLLCKRVLLLGIPVVKPMSLMQTVAQLQKGEEGPVRAPPPEPQIKLILLPLKRVWKYPLHPQQATQVVGVEGVTKLISIVPGAALC